GRRKPAPGTGPARRQADLRTGLRSRRAPRRRDGHRPAPVLLGVTDQRPGAQAQLAFCAGCFGLRLYVWLSRTSLRVRADPANIRPALLRRPVDALALAR